MKNKTGTLEWSDVSFNCVKGCGNNCRYCYAAAMNKRFTCKGSLPHPWEREVLIDRMKEAGRKYKGVVMFPTSHDITPYTCGHCFKHLKALLEAGNKVLLVSKMSDIVVSNLQREFREYACFSEEHSQLEVRITITSQIDDISKHFEPKAPLFKERLEALKTLFYKGFYTSLSIEPFLTAPELIAAEVGQYCRGNIWVGALNHYKLGNTKYDNFVKVMYLRIGTVYNSLKNNPKVKFKESFQKRLK